MEITRGNYEMFLIDYLDGKLSPVEVADLLIFLEENLDIKSEFEGVESLLPLNSSIISYPEKASLKKNLNQASCDDKDVEKLDKLFDEKSKFLHMSGTWKKAEELEIIKTGSIWYKKATIHDSAIEVSGKTAIVWNRITLESVVRGSDAKVEFTVTEVYQKQKKTWKMLALSFSSVRDTHQIKK